MKYAFASPGWMAFMHGMMVDRAARLLEEAPDVAWSICEVFTDPPRELSPDGAPLAWHAVVQDGKVEFGASERDDVDVKITVDYAAVVPLGRYDTRGDPGRAAELAALGQGLRDRGLMCVIGDRLARDPRVGNFHDAIARVTA
jgi:hypothetical protein